MAGASSWKRFDKVQVHGTIMSIGLHQRDPARVYLGARYDGEVFGTQDGGKSWQAMPLPGEVQHIYSVACGRAAPLLAYRHGSALEAAGAPALPHDGAGTAGSRCGGARPVAAAPDTPGRRWERTLRR